ncbi:YcaO-like family protein [Kocuria sp.]|uniref:YcaO-like family protein n=1 Tax=Kocuria sp. TaxID=1871328 RepID=UPI0026DFF519|nr:YcaO-like family protein [Kocuria sp.]MDO5619151.1 YcaO-like family protein [Kocuria sp.]
MDDETVHTDGLGPAQLQAYRSHLVGIVQKTYFRLHDVSDLHIISAGAKISRPEALIGTAVTRDSGGEGTSRSKALGAATGEALERYSAAWLEPSRFIHGSARSLSAAGLVHLDPDRIRFFTDAQLGRDGFGLTQLDADTRTPWLETAEVATGRRVLIPAQLAFLRVIPDAPRIHTPTSNGLAFGTDPYRALVSAMMELVERDAFMLTWYHRLSMPRIDLQSDIRLARFTEQHLEPTGLRVHVMDLSSFTGLPVVACIARPGNDEPGPIGVGASAALLPEIACMKAITEAVGSRSWAEQRRRRGADERIGDDWDNAILSFEDHIDLFSRWDMYQHLDFLDANPNIRSLNELPRLNMPSRTAVRKIASRLAEQGINLYSMDVTSPDVREMGGYVVRAYSPDLQPLDVSYRHRYLGHPRLSDPTAPPRDRNTTDLNPIPHPFP